LPLDTTVVNNMIDDLKTYGYVDRQTRLISIEKALYEPNSQLVLAIQQELIFDYLGGVTATEYYRVARILQYETSSEWACFVFELFFVYLIVYYVLQEATEIYREKWEYTKNAWNVIDLMNLTLFLIVISIRILVDSAAYALRDRVATDSYVNMQCLLYTFNLMNYCNAFNAVLCFVKIFKYLAISPKLGMLNKVIASAAGDLIGFLFMFVVVMFGFTMAFYMAFGNNVESFNNLFDAAISLFAWSLGDFDVGELQEQNYFLGSLLFVLYMILMMIMLLNFAIAIVSNAFDEVNDENHNIETDEFTQEVNAAFRAIKRALCRFVPKKYRKTINQSSLNILKISAAKYGTLSPELNKLDVVQSVEQLGQALGDKEKAEAIFAKYDEDGNGVLDQEETTLMKEELHASMNRFQKEEHKFIERRLDALEDGLKRIENMLSLSLEQNSLTSPKLHSRPPTRTELSRIDQIASE